MSAASQLRERWVAPEGAALRDAAIRWLVSGGQQPSGLGTVDGRVDLRGLTAPDPSLSGVVSVRGASGIVVSGLTEIRGQRWAGIDFSGARLLHLRFHSSTLSDCVFDGADCAGWRMWNVEVQDCSFVRAGLRDAALWTWEASKGNRWFRVSFDGADLRGSSPHRGVMEGCSFRGAKITSVHFSRVGITDCVFTGSLKNVVFDMREVPREPGGPPLRRVDFSGARLSGTEFWGCHFEEVVLPDQPGLRVVERYPAVARRILALLDGDESEHAPGLKAITANELRLPGHEDSVYVLNRADYVGMGGEGFADFVETTFMEAEQSLRS